VIASLVTGGSHLLCAMLERMVRDMGGQTSAMDTDSAMIVSTKDGGLIPCAGGSPNPPNYQAPTGNAAIKALSREEVRSTVAELQNHVAATEERIKSSTTKAMSSSILGLASAIFAMHSLVCAPSNLTIPARINDVRRAGS
jgi:hypothetical protein